METRSICEQPRCQAMSLLLGFITCWPVPVRTSCQSTSRGPPTPPQFRVFGVPMMTARPLKRMEHYNPSWHLQRLCPISTASPCIVRRLPQPSRFLMKRPRNTCSIHTGTIDSSNSHTFYAKSLSCFFFYLILCVSRAHVQVSWET